MLERSVCLSVALVVSLVGPVPVVTAAPPVPADRSETASCAEAKAAAERYAAGQYSEAAAIYEGCARSSGGASYWKKAGMARYSARQFAHAIQALGGYPRATPGAEEDAPVVAMLRDAQAQCVLVRFGVAAEAEAPRPEQLRLVPRDGVAGRDTIEIAWSRSTVALDVWLDPGAWQAELLLPNEARVGPQDVAVVQAGTSQQVLFRVTTPVAAVEAVPAAPQAVEVAVVVETAAALRAGTELTFTGPAKIGPLPSRSARTAWQLTPGTWTLYATAPRFVDVTRTVTVAGPTTVPVALTRTREDRARIGLGAAAGGVGLGLLISGMAGAIGGSKDYRAALGGIGGADRDAALGAALEGIKHTSTGTIVATSGIGASIAAATIAADASDRFLGVEVGVGAALLISGLAWLIPAKRRYYKDAAEGQAQDPGFVVDSSFLDEHRRPELVAATLLGLGTGLAAGGVAALVTRAAIRGGRRGRHASVTPIAAPRAVGLNFQAAF